MHPYCMIDIEMQHLDSQPNDGGFERLYIEQTVDSVHQSNEPQPSNRIVRFVRSLAPIMRDYLTFKWIAVYAAYSGLYTCLIYGLWHLDLYSDNYHQSVVVSNVNSSFNTWSSISYLLPVPFVDVAMKIPLLVLSVSSFCLWSASGRVTAFLDVSSIHWVIVAVLLQTMKSRRKTVVTFALNAMFLSYFTWAIWSGAYHDILTYYGGNNVETVGIVTFITSFVLINDHGLDKRLLVGCTISLVGFYFKIHNLIYNDVYGTGVFHILTATGLATILTTRTGLAICGKTSYRDFMCTCIQWAPI